MAVYTGMTYAFHNRRIWIFILLAQLTTGISLFVFPLKSVVLLAAVCIMLPVLYLSPTATYGLIYLTLPPYGMVLLQAGRLDLRPNDVAIMLGLMCLVFQAVRKNAMKIDIRSLDFPVIAIVGWTALSLLWAPHLPMAVFQFLKMMAGVLIYLLTVNLMKEKGAFNKAVSVWVWITSFWIIAGTYSLFFRSIPTAEKISKRIVEGSLPHLGKTVRVSTFFETPNDLAFIFSIALVVMVLFYMSTSSKNAKFLSGLAIVCGFAVLVATFSRKSWIGLFVSLFVIGLRHRKVFLAGALVLIPSVVMLLLTSSGSFSEALVNRIMSFFLGAELTISERAAAWAIGRTLFETSPVVGHGAGSFVVLAPTLGSPLNIPHSFYWFLLVEYGLVGLFLYVVFVASIVVRLLRLMNFSKDGQVKLFCIGLLGAVASLSFQAAFRTIGLSDPFFWAFWGLVALFLRTYDLRLKQRST